MTQRGSVIGVRARCKHRSRLQANQLERNKLAALKMLLISGYPLPVGDTVGRLLTGGCLGAICGFYAPPTEAGFWCCNLQKSKTWLVEIA